MPFVNKSLYTSFEIVQRFAEMQTQLDALTHLLIDWTGNAFSLFPSLHVTNICPSRSIGRRLILATAWPLGLFIINFSHKEKVISPKETEISNKQIQ